MIFTSTGTPPPANYILYRRKRCFPLITPLATAARQKPFGHFKRNILNTFLGSREKTRSLSPAHNPAGQTSFETLDNDYRRYGVPSLSIVLMARVGGRPVTVEHGHRLPPRHTSVRARHSARATRRSVILFAYPPSRQYERYSRIDFRFRVAPRRTAASCRPTHVRVAFAAGNCIGAADRVEIVFHDNVKSMLIGGFRRMKRRIE